jgi:hypothetical protein
VFCEWLESQLTNEELEGEGALYGPFSAVPVP